MKTITIQNNFVCYYKKDIGPWELGGKLTRN